jgi:ATP-dependent RNA helicase RhlE
MLKKPVTISLQRHAAPAVGITQAAYPVSQDLKPSLLLELFRRNILQQALVFTRTKHRANQLADYLAQQGVKAERIHGNRSQNQRTQALAGFKSGKYPVLVATDIAARGIDVEALSHVVNFDVPAVPEDYIHRVGRTGRAELTGEAFTLVAPQEEGDWRAIERAIGKVLPRVTLPDFNYTARGARPLEIPHAQRIAEIRARKAREREQSRKNAERRGSAVPRPAHAPRSAAAPHSPHAPRSPHAGPPRGGRFRPRTGRRRP